MTTERKVDQAGNVHRHRDRYRRGGEREGARGRSAPPQDRLPLSAREERTDMARLAFRVPAPLGRFIAPKGSVALEGVSLTVNEVAGDTFAVLIIPHTLQVTTLGSLGVGEPVNLEVDQMARYAARLL